MSRKAGWKTFQNAGKWEICWLGTVQALRDINTLCAQTTQSYSSVLPHAAVVQSASTNLQVSQNIPSQNWLRVSSPQAGWLDASQGSFILRLHSRVHGRETRNKHYSACVGEHMSSPALHTQRRLNCFTVENRDLQCISDRKQPEARPKVRVPTVWLTAGCETGCKTYNGGSEIR